MTGRTSLIGLLVICGIGVCSIGTTSVVQGWSSRYDLQTGKFDAPTSDHNSEAIVRVSEGC